MSKVCRFNLRGGGVLEIAPNLISEITVDAFNAELSVVALCVASHGIEHTLEEAHAIWDAARGIKTVAPEKRESLRQAAAAISVAFRWWESKEVSDYRLQVRRRLVDLANGVSLK